LVTLLFERHRYTGTQKYTYYFTIFVLDLFVYFFFAYYFIPRRAALSFELDNFHAANRGYYRRPPASYPLDEIA